MKKIDKNYKILVTPNKSKKIQEICFSQKIGWGHANEFKIQYINEQHLFIFEFCGRYNMYFCGNDDEYGFKRSPIIQIDADEFIKMYSDDSDSYTEAEEIVLEVSKELLSEVLNLNICEAYIENNKLYFDIGLPLIQNINLYEFIYKNCKEWANTQDYWTQSGYEINHLGNYFCMIRDMPDNQFFYANTEVEAIIKACEYILKRIV